MTILVTRPRKQAEQSSTKLEKLGYECIIEPLLKIQTLDTVRPVNDFDGIIITSTHAIHVLKNASLDPTVPVITTGKVTANRLISAGMLNVTSVDGSALDIVSSISDWLRTNGLRKPGQLLYPCASEVAHDIATLLAGDEFGNHSVYPWPVYKTHDATNFSSEAKRAFSESQIDSVLLYSRKTALIFDGLFSSLPQNTPLPVIFCLSEQVETALSKKLKANSRIATQPNEASLFDLIKAY